MSKVNERENKEMQRQNLGALIEKGINENDYICTKCILEYQKGHLQKKLPPPDVHCPRIMVFVIWEAILTKIVAFVI